MGDAFTTRAVIYWLLFSVLAVMLIFIDMLPVDVGAGHLPGPDLLLVLTFAWAIRRPDYVPIALVATLFLLTDLLYLRPPGLWTALVVIGMEHLRRYRATHRDPPFLMEWARIAGLIVVLTLAYRVTLAVFMVPQPTLGLALFQVLMSILSYPIVVYISRQLFGVRRPTSSEAGRLGARA